MTSRNWRELPVAAQEDLLEWLNLTKASPEDKRRLASLYFKGQFHAWDCPTCGERVYYADPDDWSYFQGVLSADYTSYPGCPEYYHPRLVAQQCNQCRMNCPSLADLDLVGIGEPSVWPEVTTA